MSHAADSDALESVRGSDEGEVDVEAHTNGKSLTEDTLGELSDIGAERFKVSVSIVIAERIGQGGYVFHTALHGDTHGAAVVAVHRAVVTVVDTANDHVRLACQNL